MHQNLTVNKMHCEYVPLSIFIQQIIIQRHGCSVLHIKVKRHTSAERLTSGKYKYAVVLLLGSCLWPSEEENHKERKALHLLYFDLPPASILVGQCTFTLKCIQISPEVNRPLKSNTQRCEMLPPPLWLHSRTSGLCSLGTCIVIIWPTSLAAFKMIRVLALWKVRQQPCTAIIRASETDCICKALAPTHQTCTAQFK